PTSALPESDVENLLSVVKQLKHEGLAIIYVTHHLDEIFELAEDVIILRDGRKVAEGAIEEWDKTSLVKAMLARQLDEAYPYHERNIGEAVLEVKNLCAPRVKNTSFSLQQGEVLGLIGLAGAGRTELMKAIAGAAPIGSGAIKLRNVELKTGSIDF